MKSPAAPERGQRHGALECNTTRYHSGNHTKNTKRQQYEELRNRLLRELRLAHIRTRSRLLHIEFVGHALRNRLVSAHEAMRMLETPEMLACFPEEAGT